MNRLSRHLMHMHLFSPVGLHGLTAAICSSLSTPRHTHSLVVASCVHELEHHSVTTCVPLGHITRLLVWGASHVTVLCRCHTRLGELLDLDIMVLAACHADGNRLNVWRCVFANVGLKYNALCGHTALAAHGVCSSCVCDLRITTRNVHSV